VVSAERARIEGGAMYDLPYGYPAVIAGDGAVYGEVLTFSDESAALDIMDELEGYCGPGKLNLYDRVRMKAILSDGSLVDCYVYVFPDTKIPWLEEHARQVDGGDWLEYRHTAGH
ncbi:MAG: gamma-glutamylcyclotransferase, partial [Firmicutes bacterium]|nr:gamma-glutamylcyclotransferase [Bacillota bacterium]